MKMKKRLTAWLTCAAMVLSLFAAMPMAVSADEPVTHDINGSPVNIVDDGKYIITGDGTATTNKITVAAHVYADITLDNVNIDVSGTNYDCAFLIEADSTGDVNITLVGENILKSGFARAGIEKGGSGDGMGTLTIEGTGSLIAESYSRGAGIGGGNSGSTSRNIIINSGTITATGGSVIGTGSSASGGGGAGIGGANGGHGSHIAINGGTVTANGGNAALSGVINTVTAAAGIGGGGNGGHGTHITITDGTVTAQGGNRGAGIGGGYGGYGSDITISGGTVVANGGSSSYQAGGAGIGGGSFQGGGGSGGHGTNITISGGTVTATGGTTTGEGIGHGGHGSSDNISIIPADGMQISVYVGSTEPGTLLGTYTETTPYTSTDRYFHSEEEPVAVTLTDITVSPSTTTVEKGGTETFTATVVYSDDSTDADVAWSITGNSSIGTAINASGVLTVASEEEAKTLTVTATSNADSGKSGNADVTVIDVPVTEYTLTVNNGSGGGEYAAGAEISITAEAPSSDQAFDKWISSNGGAFAEETESTTTFTMPAHAVTVTATYKDKVVTPDTYTVTISGGGSGASGSGSYEEGATVTINAGNRSNYSFNGWTSSQAVTFAEASAASTSFTMPADDITVTANWTYNGGGSSGGGGGSISPTVPAADGAVNVSYSTSQGTADLSLSTSKVNDIIDKSKEDEAVIDLSKVRGITGASLPTSALKAFEEAGLDITVKLPEGTITLDKEAAASVTEQASSTITIEIEEATPPSLTKEQRETINEDDLVLDINIYSGTRKITNFGGTLTIQVPYTGPEPVAVWYLNDQGELEKLNSTFEDGVVTFTTDHLSLYVIGEDTEEPEKEEPFTNPFTDVQEGAWYYDAVKYVYENSLMMGTGDTTFGTNGTTTRGMLVTILHRLSGEPEAGMSSFSDVAADKYYAKAVAWAAENRIVSGYGNGIFGPEDSITREQMAAILMNYAEFKDYDVTARADLSKYTDADTVSDWARDAMAWANAEGLIQGDGAGLNATGKATRAQVAAILQRFITEITE